MKLAKRQSMGEQGTAAKPPSWLPGPPSSFLLDQVSPRSHRGSRPVKAPVHEQAEGTAAAGHGWECQRLHAQGPPHQASAPRPHRGQEATGRGLGEAHVARGTAPSRKTSPQQE